MLFEKILGNIKNIKNKEIYKIEKIILKSDDLEKKILRVKSTNGNEYGINLKNSTEKLKNGSILYNDKSKIIFIETDLEKILVVLPKNIIEMGEISYFLGNMHIPINIENEKIYLHYDKYLDNILREKKYTFDIEYLKLKKALRHIEHNHKNHGQIL